MENIQQHFVWFNINLYCGWTEQERCDCFSKMEQNLPLYFEGASQFSQSRNTLHFVLFWPEQDDEAIRDGLCNILKEMAAQLLETSPDIFGVRVKLMENRRYISFWKKPFYLDLLMPHTIAFEPRLLVRVVLTPSWVYKHHDLSESIMLEFAEWFLKEYPDSEQNECRQGNCVFFANGCYLSVNSDGQSFVEQLWKHLCDILTPKWEEAVELVTASVDWDGYLTSPPLKIVP